jgi:hypothetical protein
VKDGTDGNSALIRDGAEHSGDELSDSGRYGDSEDGLGHSDDNEDDDGAEERSRSVDGGDVADMQTEVMKLRADCEQRKDENAQLQQATN